MLILISHLQLKKNLHSENVDSSEFDRFLIVAPFTITDHGWRVIIVVQTEVVVEDLLQILIGLLGRTTSWHTHAQFKNFSWDQFVSNLAVTLVVPWYDVLKDFLHWDLSQTVLATNLVSGAYWQTSIFNTFLVVAHADLMTPEDTHWHTTP